MKIPVNAADVKADVKRRQYDYWLKVRYSEKPRPARMPVDDEGWSEEGREFYKHVCDALRVLAKDDADTKAINIFSVTYALASVEHLYNEHSEDPEYTDGKLEDLKKIKKLLDKEKKTSL